MLRLIVVMLLLVVQTAHAQPGSDRYALLIGNSNYQQAGLVLPNPVKDIESVGRSLSKAGFTVEYAKDIPTLEAFDKRIRQFSEKVKSINGVAMVYYAGHGTGFNGQNFLMPTKPEYRYIEDVTAHGIDIGYILEILGASNQRVNLMVVDACRNNDFKPKPGSTLTRSGISNVPTGMVESKYPTGNVIAFSTSYGAGALDEAVQNKNLSPYAQAFNDALTEAEQKDLINFLIHVGNKLRTHTEGKQQAKVEMDLLQSPPPLLPYSSQGLDNAAAQTQENARLKQELEQLRRQQAANPAASNTLAMASPSPAAQTAALPLIANRYRDNQDGTITDTQTKLQWKRCSEGQSWNGSRCTGEAGEYKWEEASKLTSNFADKTDWRLPTMRELHTLCSNHNDNDNDNKKFIGCDKKALINTQAFPATPDSVFWSSSEEHLCVTGKCYRLANSGNGEWIITTIGQAVRLVRSQ